ncbi:hypothetical protein TVAG_131140 [Trichomonas vaginalis G3]|uniref:Uncharacterized protein n=1 Tax=Trichomonas vaginalis (strain ATCC PRA-98 / G3) TaxID=412133 RepID=A2EPN7_TRIV3|nr:armadillo (ARM) repeat-containing protein family [Trichomonas vaginalis G3]EAY05380.1 hypothetical protein TVAG_131140 [Trichomonas vaginalis G3]KAI5524066.1 armadillo (ARM) repeat-containing protein family [Trichomonas vaginalis G3]|eukprot:XP_001317603.1 hypothetical protein [Trichomonas vaginalis G3]
MNTPVENLQEITDLISMLTKYIDSDAESLLEDEITLFNEQFFEKAFICLSFPDEGIAGKTLKLLYNMTVYLSSFKEIFRYVDQQFIDLAFDIPNRFPRLIIPSLTFIYNLFFVSYEIFALSLNRMVDLIEMTKNVNDKATYNSSVEYMYILIKDFHNAVEFPENFLYDYLLWATLNGVNMMRVYSTVQIVLEIYHDGIEVFVHDSALIGQILVTLADASQQSAFIPAITILIWLIEKTDYMTTSIIIDVVNHLDELLHDSGEATVKAWELMEIISQRSQFLSNELLETNFVQNVLDVFMFESSVRADAKIKAVRALINFILVLSDEQLNFLPMDSILELFEEVETDSIIPDDLLNQVKIKLTRQN